MIDPDFIEKFGLLFEQEGMPRIAGRIIAFLMLEGGPCALDDLSERLQISKTSASTNTRLLEQLGILEHISKAGDRRDYYELADDYGERMFVMAKQRMERFRKLLAETSSNMPAGEAASRDRLDNMTRFYAFLLADLDGIVERWREYQGAGAAGGSNTGTE